MAMPSARVAIWAEVMLTPYAASVPAIRENSPGTSRVTTTKVGGAEVGMVEQLGGHRHPVEPADQPQMLGHPLDARWW